MQLFFNGIFGLYTTGFYVLAIIALIMLTIFLENESEGWLTICTLVYSITTSFSIGFSEVYQYVVLNKYDIAISTVAYALIGVFWAVCKVYFKSRPYKAKIQALNTFFKYDSNNCRSREEQYKAFLRNKLNSDLQDSRVTNFLVNGPKSKQIIMWMAYWPLSAGWTILNDPIRRFASFVYHVLLSGMFKRIHSFATGVKVPNN